MEPKKYLKHYHFDGFDYEKELYKLLNNINRRIQRRGGNWVVTSPRVTKVLNNLENEHRR